MATTGIAPPQALTNSDGSTYNKALAAALAAQNGGQALTEQQMLSLLLPQQGLTKQPDPTYFYNGQTMTGTPTGSGAEWDGSGTAAQPRYTDSLGRMYVQTGTDASGKPILQAHYGNADGSWENPIGGGKGRVQPTYTLGADGTATPLAANTSYDPSTWVGMLRDPAIALGTVLSAGAAGYLGAGAGALGGSGAAGGSAAGGNMALIDSGLGTAGYGGSSAGTIAMGDGLGSAASGALTDYGGSAEANQAAPEVANTGSDAHFYQPQQGGTGVQDLGNMGGAGTATIPSMTIQNPSNMQQLQQLLTSKGGQQALGSLAGNGNGLSGTALGGLFGLGAAALAPKASDMNVPNYAAAAQSQAASGRMDQSNPWANLSYTQNGVDAQGNPVYKQNVSLNPADQANLDSARSGQGAALFGLGNSISGYDAAVKGLPGLYGDKGTQQGLTQQAIDSMYHQQTALLDPQYQENQRALQSQLANQGVVQGSQAYNQAMDSYARQRDYAYGNARDSSISQGNTLANQLFNQNLAAHNTGMQDLSTQQNQYLTDANGLSNTVKTPSFQATPSPTNYLGAAALQGQGNLNQYNAATGNANSFTNGLFNLGGAVMSNPAWTSYLGNLFSTGGG